MSDLLYRAARPLLHAVNAETAHGLAIRALSAGLVPASREADDPVLRSLVFGRDLANPIGLAAGFDKDGQAIDPLLALGFGHVEIGTVTPRSQPGNPRPRVFRLAADRAVVNRYGFNSAGLDAMAARLEVRGRAGGVRPAGLVGINVGKNKESADETSDFVAGIERMASFADYLVINLSSPNTPGLRSLQRRDAFERVAQVAVAARNRAGLQGASPPLLAKLAPDLDDDELADVARVALESGLDGLIMGNTTLSRSADLRSPTAREAGGLSGQPLLALSTDRLATLYRLIGGRIPLVGAGGVSSGADAYAKIRAGASLVQLYSALVFEGPGLVGRIKRDLAALLRRDGFASVADAVGADGP